MYEDDRKLIEEYERRTGDPKYDVDADPRTQAPLYVDPDPPESRTDLLSKISRGFRSAGLRSYSSERWYGLGRRIYLQKPRFWFQGWYLRRLIRYMHPDRVIVTGKS